MTDANQAVNLAQALIVPLAAGFVVQRFMEIADSIFGNQKPSCKKIAMGLISLIIGWVLAFYGFRVFAPLGAKISSWADILLSGVFISAGTEGFNSLLKLANYSKEAAKAEAADKLSAVKIEQMQMVNKQS